MGKPCYSAECLKSWSHNVYQEEKQQTLPHRQTSHLWAIWPHFLQRWNVYTFQSKCLFSKYLTFQFTLLMVKWSVSSSTWLQTQTSECWPLSTGTLVLASFQNSTRQIIKLNFSSLLSNECSLPEVGFSTDGIAQHIKSFFTEQWRFHKNKQKGIRVIIKTFVLSRRVNYVVGLFALIKHCQIIIIQWPSVIDFEHAAVYTVEFVGCWNN